MLVLPMIIGHKTVIAISFAVSLLFDTDVVAPPSSPGVFHPDVNYPYQTPHLIYPSCSPLHAPASTSSWLASSKSVSLSTKPVTTSITIERDSIIDNVLSSPVLPTFLRRYDSANDIPQSYYTQHKILRGRVVRVIDGDTIRIRHTPLLYSIFSSNSKGNGIDGCSKKKNSECTISVRLYGVDAPETPKFGNPGQPFSREAKDFVSDLVYNKVVKIKLLSKDQYSRAVGSVISTTTTPRSKFVPFLMKTEESDLSLKLLERGYATLYTGRGAQYNDRRDDLVKKMELAKENRLGMWSIPKDDGKGEELVDPAAYKRAMKARMKSGKVIKDKPR